MRNQDTRLALRLRFAVDVFGASLGASRQRAVCPATGAPAGSCLGLRHAHAPRTSIIPILLERAALALSLRLTSWSRHSLPSLRAIDPWPSTTSAGLFKG